MNSVTLSSESDWRPVVRRIALLLVMTLLLVGGLLVQPAAGVQHQDKLHHALGFFCLALTLRMGFPTLSVAELLILSFAAACSVEMGQAPAPGRTSTDVAASMTGALLGWGSGWSVQRLVHARNTPSMAAEKRPTVTGTKRRSASPSTTSP